VSDVSTDNARHYHAARVEEQRAKAAPAE